MYIQINKLNFFHFFLMRNARFNKIVKYKFMLIKKIKFIYLNSQIN